MKLFASVGDFFALDIGSTSVRVVQLTPNGAGWQLVKYGTAPIDIKVSSSDSPEDQRRLGDIIVSLVTQVGITTPRVVVGIPSTKTFTTVVDLPDLPVAELSSTIKYQAEQYIPMPIEEVKLDWAVLGKSLRDPSKVEVLIASVSNKFSEERLDLIEGLGFNVIAIEPDPIALARSLIPADNREAHMIIDFGDFSTDIVMVLTGAPRLVRTIPVGMQTLIKAVTQNLNIDTNQATQFILKFGLYPDRLEGQILRALDPTLDQFASEISKSSKFFQSRYTNVPISSIVLSGYTISIPAFGEYLTSKTGMPAVPGNAWSNVSFGLEMRDQLVQVAPQFGVVVGLAERTL